MQLQKDTKLSGYSSGTVNQSSVKPSQATTPYGLRLLDDPGPEHYKGPVDSRSNHTGLIIKAIPNLLPPSSKITIMIRSSFGRIPDSDCPPSAHHQQHPCFNGCEGLFKKCTGIGLKLELQKGHWQQGLFSENIPVMKMEGTKKVERLAITCLEQGDCFGT
ncbi:hypothetical protein ACFE04_016882 [Oxalis oulophora]